MCESHVDSRGEKTEKKDKGSGEATRAFRHKQKKHHAQRCRKVKSKADEAADEQLQSFQALSKRALRNKFVRSLKATRKMGTGKASKRMQDQFEQATPQEKQTMYDEWIKAKGEWGTLELREHLTKRNKNTRRGKRVWLFADDVVERFGQKRGEKMLKRLRKSKAFCRQHPDMDSDDEDGRQYHILCVDENEELSESEQENQAETKVAGKDGSVPTKVTLRGTTGTMGGKKSGTKGSKQVSKPGKGSGKGEDGKGKGKDKGQKTLLKEAKSWLTKVPKDLTSTSQALTKVGLPVVQRKMPATFVTEYRTLLSQNLQQLKTLRGELEENAPTL